MTKPNPGSEEAIDMGCTCPVLDNCHGKGFPFEGRTEFWYSSGCPVHMDDFDTARETDNLPRDEDE